MPTTTKQIPTVIPNTIPIIIPVLSYLLSSDVMRRVIFDLIEAKGPKEPPAAKAECKEPSAATLFNNFCVFRREAYC